MTAIETAIPFDLEEPLLITSRRNVDDDDDDGEHNEHEETEEDVVIDEEVVKNVLDYFQMLGWTLGFILQCISLGATAVMALYWDHVPNTRTATLGERCLYWIVYGLSNAWLLLFPVVCITMERSWRRSGIRFLQIHILDIPEPIFTQQTKRMTFVSSVRFLIGIVLGCFMTWGLIDMYLGASYSMLLALLLSMMACLILCRGMIIIYDIISS